MKKNIKNYIRYVPVNGNDTTEHKEFFIYSLENEYLGFITIESRHSNVIVFTEYNSGSSNHKMQYINRYPSPYSKDQMCNRWINKNDKNANTNDKDAMYQMQIVQKYHHNWQQQYNQQMQQQKKKHFHQQIHPHMRYKFQQR